MEKTQTTSSKVSTHLKKRNPIKKLLKHLFLSILLGWNKEVGDLQSHLTFHKFR